MQLRRPPTTRSWTAIESGRYLVVEQPKQPHKDNFGIRSLPNLETKFVAANTLVGLHKPQLTLRNTELDRLEEELRHLRHQYFGAKTRKEKLTWQSKDKELREQISELLVSDGWESSSAKHIAEFDPYDQNATSSFFDPEWMFGLRANTPLAGVFDIVVGNPPYIDSEGMVNIGQKDLREYITGSYKYAKGNWDIYIAFFEKGISLLDKHGCIAFITPDKWIAKPFGEELRKGIVNRLKFIAVTGRNVFESANVDSIITLISNVTTDNLKVLEEVDGEIVLSGEYPKSILGDNCAFDWLFSKNIDIVRQITALPKTLQDFCCCENACATSDAYKLKPLIQDLMSSTQFDRCKYLKMVNTGTIGKYLSKWGLSEMTYLKDKYLSSLRSK